MTRKKVLYLTFFSSILIFSFLFLTKKFFIPFYNHLETENLVKDLEDSGKVVNGDIIFQTSLSSQSKAIQLATHSKYSHCGIIFWDNADCWVWEASEGVTVTALDKFIERGEGKHFVIKRLKNRDSIFNSSGVPMKMVDLFNNNYDNKPYDSYFGWSDDKIYCSELVWKLYKQSTGIEIGTLEKLSDFDLTNKVVQEKMRERYGNNVPLNEIVISPANIFNSDLLRIVKSN